MYRLKHIPSGLYFIPSRLIKAPGKDIFLKSNLSKTGKVYHTKPSLSFVGDHFYDHRHGVEKFLAPTIMSEWTIEYLCSGDHPVTGI